MLLFDLSLVNPIGLEKPQKKVLTRLLVVFTEISEYKNAMSLTKSEKWLGDDDGGIVRSIFFRSDPILCASLVRRLARCLLHLDDPLAICCEQPQVNGGRDDAAVGGEWPCSPYTATLVPEQGLVALVRVEAFIALGIFGPRLGWIFATRTALATAATHFAFCLVFFFLIHLS